MQGDGAHLLWGQSTQANDAGYYQFHWSAHGNGLPAVTVNANGTTGWATIMSSTNSACKPRTQRRIHICMFKPCKAVYPTSKYGLVGPPLHLQEVPKPDELMLQKVREPNEPTLPAVAAPSTASSSSVNEFAPVAPALVVEPAPEEEPTTALQPEVSSDVVLVPGSPKGAALQYMRPPAPASPMDVDSFAVSIASCPEDGAQRTIESTLLALAREIRRPHAYVGYSAFLLMAFLKKCRPCVWEGSSFIDLLDVFAPWGKEQCTKPVVITAVPCAVIAQAGGSVELAPISVDHPLSSTKHFVAGMPCPACEVQQSCCSFEVLYASLGVNIMPTVLDGDCAFDVMCLMLGQPCSLSARKELRLDVSDYLIARIGESWMHDVMLACQELRAADVSLYRSGGSKRLTAPTAAAPAVAALAVAEQQDVVAVDEETFAAIRWASKLDNDSCVLSLVRSLPKKIVEEQVSLYRRRDASAVAKPAQEPEPKIKLVQRPNLKSRMLVAQRLHLYCRKNGIQMDKKMPYGSMKTFIADNIAWKSHLAIVTSQRLKSWYVTWASSPSNVLAAVAEEGPVPVRGSQSMLKSRGKVPDSLRCRGHGGGRHPKVPCVREALYEWFSGLRYAIDWKQLIAENRSRGKKHLARFPRSVILLKLQQLIQDHTHACLLTGMPVVAITPNGWWCKRWEEDYGLSMRKANRKYAVPRPVIKERLEVFLVSLFRLRKFIMLTFGYDPLLENFDQSPFHHNETGSQNKPTLAVKGSIVPVVEGNHDTKSRWTANLTTQSRFTGTNKGDPMPAAECMFKAAKDGSINTRVQAFLVSHGFPTWFTVTVGPKGSYREYDIIEWLRKHLEPWTEGRDWRIYMCDDYVCHKTKNVWNLCWSRGYIRMVHGGGCTPVGQTPDTDLNEHVRRGYGHKECCLLLEKMRSGQVVPRLEPEECMQLMLEVLSDPALHMRAAEGYKRVGQSIALDGDEDDMVCREAGTFWREETTDHFLNMRAKINHELALVEDEFKTGGITWCERDVMRLITPYPERKKVDAILNRLGEDFYHDDIHALANGDGLNDDLAVAEGDQEEAIESSSSDADDEPAVADELPDGAASAEIEKESAPISAEQADSVHKARATMAALEGMIQGLQAIGSISGVQSLELELSKEKRKVRHLVAESPAVAEAFSRLRNAEDQQSLTLAHAARQQKDRKRAASKAIADRDAAAATLRETKRKIQELEGVGACRHAIKTFTLESLGHGSKDAGGAKARNKRWEVLDRLARIRAGLSPGQSNDWTWFKEAWDKEMANQHGAEWPSVFAKWVQNVMEDERSNAFSTFVHQETCRVFHGTAALNVPGG